MLGHFLKNARRTLCRLAVIGNACTLSVQGQAQSVATPHEGLVASDEFAGAGGHARVFFRRHEYQKAIIALKGETKSLSAKWIMAESLFQLRMYGKSQAIFKEILRDATDVSDREKATARLFEIDLFLKDIDSAIHRFVTFEKEFKRVPGRMAYAMGKELHDINYLNHSEEILHKIPEGDEYFMRARYILAAMGLKKRSIKDSIALFNKIEKSKIVSTEDYWIRDLAILAQARLLADNGQLNLAEAMYMRVPLTSAFGEIATTELVRSFMHQRELAKFGIERFKKVPAKQRESIATRSLDSAMQAINRLRKVQQITWRTPELMSLMAWVMVEAKRYADARVAFDELIGHFRPIRSMVMASKEREELWPYFAIDYERSPKTTSSSLPVIGGVPASLLRGLSDVKEIISLRDRIEEGGRKLLGLEEQARRFGAKVDNMDLAKARSSQVAIEAAYRAMVIKKQHGFRGQVTKILGNFLAEAEFKRADLVIAEMRHVEKQLGVVQDFTRKNIDLFETKLKALDDGGTP